MTQRTAGQYPVQEVDRAFRHLRIEVLAHRVLGHPLPGAIREQTVHKLLGVIHSER
jgi:hypothetical protein